MSLFEMRSMLEEINRRRQRVWSGSQLSTSTGIDFSPAPSILTQQSEDFESDNGSTKVSKLPSDVKMLQRARDIHASIDFAALAAGPGHGGPWERVEAADRFVVFKHQTTTKSADNKRLEVMCAGRINASLEEVSSILRSGSDVDFSATMEGLYSNKFVFGSLDRDIPCQQCLAMKKQHETDQTDSKEQLTVKTCSFLRTTLFAHNEQWCFFELFQRKKNHDGFTISQCALPPREPTPGRIVRDDARVDQLHGLNASYLVDQLPNRKGLRVVFKAWFDQPLKCIQLNNCSSLMSISTCSSSRSSSFSPSSSENAVEIIDTKAQQRRLLALAHGILRLPGLVRRRRFGMQVPADHEFIQVSNPRCPCCTHSLAPVKMSFAIAASALATRSFRSLKMDTRRCYLCGYLICMDCWKAEYMESGVGKVAAIVVCSRCQACVNACDYSEACASNEKIHLGPVKVVDDPPKTSPAPLLVDFLVASLVEAPLGGADRAAVLSVVRTLLSESENSDSSDYSDEDESFTCEQSDKLAVTELGNYLGDENQLPELESCVLANAERRGYTIDLPTDPVNNVPRSVIPSHDNARLKLVADIGLLQLANELAPLEPWPRSFDNACNVRDLELLCQLAVRATGCTEAFVTVMGVKHNHILATTNPDFIHAAVPREQTMCQHTILTDKPFVATHPEADVRFHAIESVKHLKIRYYVGFPVTVPMPDTMMGSSLQKEMPVGTLCCIDSKARSELTRSQYATMKRLTDTASRLIQLKGRRLQHRDQRSTVPLAA